METKEINIAEILKDCPKGIKLYSPILGNVAFDRITDTAIIVVAGCSEYRFRWNGKYHITNAGECMLFPDKDQHDWSDFTNPSKPPFEICQCKEYETFYFIDEDLKVASAKQYNIPLTGTTRFKSGNYFNNQYQAEYAAEKVKELLLSLRKEVE